MENPDSNQMEEDGDPDYFCVDDDDDDAESSSSDEYGDETEEPKRKKSRHSSTCKLADDNSKVFYERRIAPFTSGTVEDNIITVLNKKSKTEWKIDEKSWNNLYDYQKEGVQWFQNHYEQKVGAILADEMGLGKTIQTIMFLRSIQETGKFFHSLNCKGLGRSLLICPASVMKQWIDELNKWFPKCRVFVLHSTSSTGVKIDELCKTLRNRPSEYPFGCVVITTYAMFLKNNKALNGNCWHLAFLDEGHKIKNAETKNCQAIKNMITPYRYVLSGSPIQNNLLELWTLIDFVYPGKLGSVETFTARIVRPIQDGSFLHANPQLKENAYQCALILQEAVKPYILRRLKSDPELNLQLPDKNEQILFCNLTSVQRATYEKYLKSDQVRSILNGRCNALAGIIQMFHICNHPGIFEKRSPENREFGRLGLSGKMKVLKKLMKVWHKEEAGHKLLIFTQRKTVMDMLEYFCEKMQFKYRKMSGETPVGQRHAIVEEFTNDPDVFVFILTTKVGGIGLNLTAANKIVIFDPDWNPSTDDQAKERAWRIGQNRDVTIYRLITSGTIEEKAYLRQIHKQTLAMRVFENADTKQIIPKEGLRELFTLAPEGVKGSESGLYVQGELVPREKSSKSDKKKIRSKDLDQYEDRKTLRNLFEGDMLTSIISHATAVKNEQDKMILKINARQCALDAAKYLIHSEGRLSKDWEAKFVEGLKNDKTGAKEREKKEPKNSFWSAIHKNLKQNDGQDELDKNVQKARDVRMAFHANGGKLTHEKLNKYFKPMNMVGVDKYFYKEMLSTMARFDHDQKVFILKSKYK